MDRLHFFSPCLHTLLNAAPEITRVGPGAYLTQFIMERAIGDLGGDIRQPSNIYGTLVALTASRNEIRHM
jgi:hypothetical protein